VQLLFCYNLVFASFLRHILWWFVNSEQLLVDHSRSSVGLHKSISEERWQRHWTC